MRFLAFLIIASVILSLARALTLVLILVLAISLLWALFTKPMELLGLVLLALMTEALSSRPATTIVCVAFVATIIAVRRPAGKND